MREYRIVASAAILLSFIQQQSRRTLMTARDSFIFTVSKQEQDTLRGWLICILAADLPSARKRNVASTDLFPLAGIDKIGTVSGRLLWLAGPNREGMLELVDHAHNLYPGTADHDVFHANCALDAAVLLKHYLTYKISVPSRDRHG